MIKGTECIDIISGYVLTITRIDSSNGYASTHHQQVRYELKLRYFSHSRIKLLKNIRVKNPTANVDMLKMRLLIIIFHVMVRKQILWLINPHYVEIVLIFMLYSYLYFTRIFYNFN